MAPIPIPQVLAKSRVTPHSKVIALENVLQSIEFVKQVTAWASQTGAGQAIYTGVGVVKDLPFESPKSRIVATISCEKTPKTTGFASWTCKDAITWTYTTTSGQQIHVQVEPRDTLRRMALVGGCIQTEIDDTAAGKPISVNYFTLGLIIRQRQVQGATNEVKWAVLVSHAFSTAAELKADSPHGGVARHDSWKVRVCGGPDTAPETQCANCKSDKCYSCKPGIQWATGREEIVRSMDWINDMSLVRLPSQPSPPIVPLDIKEFKQKILGLKPTEFQAGFLDQFKDLLQRAELRIDEFATPDLINQILDDTGVWAYAFKKGAQTSWSWGIINTANKHRVWMRSVAMNWRDHPLVDSGDCGSIWFMIDAFTDSNHPVIKPMAIVCLAHHPLEKDGQADYQAAGADFYSPALTRSKGLGDDVSLPGMLGCPEQDLEFAAADSFQLTA